MGPDARMAVDVVVVLEELRTEGPGLLDEPNRWGNAGQYVRVLNAASEEGLSLLTWASRGPRRGR